MSGSYRDATARIAPRSPSAVPGRPPGHDADVVRTPAADRPARRVLLEQFVERGLEARLLGAIRIDPQLTAGEAGERVARLEPAWLDLDAGHRRAPASCFEQLDRVRQGREWDAILAV